MIWIWCGEPGGIESTSSQANHLYWVLLVNYAVISLSQKQKNTDRFRHNTLSLSDAPDITKQGRVISLRGFTIRNDPSKSFRMVNLSCEPAQRIFNTHNIYRSLQFPISSPDLPCTPLPRKEREFSLSCTILPIGLMDHYYHRHNNIYSFQTTLSNNVQSPTFSTTPHVHPTPTSREVGIVVHHLPPPCHPCTVHGYEAS
jgi:hypothetical protein